MLLEMCISYMKTGNHILESQKRAELSALKSVFKFFSPEAHVFFGSGYDSLHESSLLSSHEKLHGRYLHLSHLPGPNHTQLFRPVPAVKIGGDYV